MRKKQGQQRSILEKSETSRKWRAPGTPAMLWTVFAVLLIAIIAVVLWVWPGVLRGGDSADLSAYGNNALDMAMLEPDAFNRLSGETPKLEVALEPLRRPFDELGEDGAKDDRLKAIRTSQADFRDVAFYRKSVRLDKDELSYGGSYTAADQLKWGNYLLARNQLKTFRHWLDGFRLYFIDANGLVIPEVGESGGVLTAHGDHHWPLQLQYVRLLLNAEKREAVKHVRDDIFAQIELLLPIMREPPATESVTFPSILYPLTSSEAEPTPAPVDPEADRMHDVIALKDVDLWTLRALAINDDRFQPIYDYWEDKVVNAQIAEGIYAYGVRPSDGAYINTVGEPFEVYSYAASQIALHLAEVGHDVDAFLDTAQSLLSSGGKLYASYHMVSLTPIDTEQNLAALGDIGILAKLTERDLLAERAEAAARLQYADLKESKVYGLFFREVSGDSYLIAAEDNLSLLLTGLYD